MSEQRVWRCDRCGFEMIERHCKVICPNCGQRWDCSDVTIWVGDARLRAGRRGRLDRTPDAGTAGPTS